MAVTGGVKHVTAANFEDNDKELEQKKKEADETIEKFVARLKLKKKVLSQPFYFIHFNYYCHIPGRGYVPAEVGLCEWNIESGIKQTWHSFIHPGEGAIPTGYDSALKEIREETHKIFYPPLSDTKPLGSVEEVLCEITRFVTHGQDRDPPPIFTYYNKENFHFVLDNSVVVENILRNMSVACGVDHKFRIFPVVKLFHELKNACSVLFGKSKFPSIAFAELEMERDEYQQRQVLGCHYHKSRDAVGFCSLSYVQRWAFVITKQCGEDAGIQLVLGRHLPESPKVVYTEEVTNKFWRRRNDKIRNDEIFAPKQDVYDESSNEGSEDSCLYTQRTFESSIPTRAVSVKNECTTDEEGSSIAWEIPEEPTFMNNVAKTVKTNIITSTVMTQSVTMKEMTTLHSRSPVTDHRGPFHMNARAGKCYFFPYSLEETGNPAFEKNGFKKNNNGVKDVNMQNVRNFEVGKEQEKAKEMRIRELEIANKELVNKNQKLENKVEELEQKLAATNVSLHEKSVIMRKQKEEINSKDQEKKLIDDVMRKTQDRVTEMSRKLQRLSSSANELAIEVKNISFSDFIV